MIGRDSLVPTFSTVFQEWDAYHNVSLADLARQKRWPCVQNLVRRQVVPESEYKELVCGWTAEQWALVHGQFGIAREIAYYVSLPTSINT